ncbi:MAG: CHAD domain-containing protein [Gemmatimonadales bacterium]|nr:CHAD domain-containing protein [Gemmatimonadales bacterium]NIN12990.1 CHAD domain-containing protein [Gemmatimonadales bacterium]NIN51067.1 CHAD domain-containing protein [Gemmatimonadales bacterium]NIP08531.1 CHAD domain-containing protein [Gemmatimonadales bacterium]NIR02249.1 CHAD domain-containing protein [Gemmatimonadales bacterium]
MPKYPENLLRQPPAAAVAVLGDTLLDAARSARARLEEGDDEEALHDFRVALRRLRSVLRAFRSHLQDFISRNLRRQLRDLQRATNPARDAEVQAAWVHARLKQLTRGQRVGARWFLARLEEHRDRAYDAALQAIDADFERLARRVVKRLGSAAGSRDVAGPQSTFAGALTELIRDHAAALQGRLSTIRSPSDEAEVHATRISGKRLRYLLELVANGIAAADRAVVELKGLQTVLGELHDVQVVAREFAAAAEVAAAEHARRLHELERVGGSDDREVRAARRRNATPGMLALARFDHQVQQELFDRFAAEWGSGFPGTFRRELDEVLKVLAEHSAPPVEVERKYLLSRLPATIQSAKSAEIEQGWLPGRQLQERLRRIYGPDGDRYYRTVKVGSGVSRIEIEEEASATVFEHLWPLTEGRRLRKRRYYVPDGELTWEIDEFLDRELVLAEVELPSAAISVTPPTWLASVVLKDVTGESEYLNVNLAK